MDGVIRLEPVNDVNTTHVSRIGVPWNLVAAIVGKDGRRGNELERKLNSRWTG